VTFVILKKPAACDAVQNISSARSDDKLEMLRRSTLINEKRTTSRLTTLQLVYVIRVSTHSETKLKTHH